MIFGRKKSHDLGLSASFFFTNTKVSGVQPVPDANRHSHKPLAYIVGLKSVSSKDLLTIKKDYLFGNL